MRRLLAATVAFLSLQACDAGPRETGVIEGLVKLGPIVPVCREGEPCDGVYKGANVVLRKPGGAAIKRVTANDKGAFWIDSPAGVYEVGVDVEGPMPTCAPVRVIVKAGETMRVEIDCDSGIR